jgi:nonribosomal peptide synthetase DhbF
VGALTEEPLVGGGPDRSVDASIIDLFDAVLSRHATREAVVCLERTMTYQQLADRVDRIAYRLCEHHVARGDRVAIMADRGPDAIAAMLGAIKSGAMAVPLVPTHPEARHRQVLADAGARILVSDARHLDAATAVFDAGTVMPLDDLPPPARYAWPTLNPSDPACIVYTSGSTGRPRGVIQTHRTVTRRLSVVQDRLHLTADDRIAMFSTAAVGQGLTLMFGTVLTGATLCPFDVRAHGVDRLAAWLVDAGITVCYLSATLFRVLARSWKTPPLPALRLIRLASERIVPEDIALCRRVFGRHTQLMVGYSSTETGNITLHQIGPDDTFPEGIVPVGRASSGIEVLVVDEHGRDLPVGTPGEIAVRGRFLSPGYWRDDERTGQAFREERDVPGVRVYFTGDLGRLRPDGLLEHHGRKDRRIKIRGFRVELEEVESVLATYAHVQLAAVAARPGAGGELTLVAYVQFDPGAPGDVEDLRAFAAGRLPDYMVPSVFVPLAELPLTDSGKIDRQNLPDPSMARPSRASALAPARTPMEELVASVWREVLSLDEIGLHDSFMLVGGDSLRAAQIASRLSERLDLDISLGELLDAATIAEQVRLLTERGGSAPT